MTAEKIKEEPRLLEGAQLYGYSSGVFGQILPIVLINSYIFIYYTYVIGLNALLVSIGTAIGSTILALSAPIFGFIVDKKKPSKIGKRRPFLLYSLPVLVLSIIIIWYSPAAQQFGSFNWGITLFLWSLLGLFFLSYSLLRATYLSMTPEQSQDEENRIKIGSLIGMFSILGTVLGIFIPLILQSQLENPDNIYNTPQDREFLFFTLPLLGWVVAIITILFTLAAYYSTDEDFLEVKEQSIEGIKKQKANLKDVFKNLLRPFKDQNFKLYILSILLMSIGIRILTKDLPLFMTFVLYLRDAEFITYILPLIIFAVLGFVLWSKRANTKGVKKTYVQATWMISFSLIATALLLIEMPEPIMLWA
ncbi:MAG: MFS transporter, partial [Promethearchaeota archaeon]